MPSPFPGMNPYLERRPQWGAFHPKFVNAAHTALVAQVRPRYIALLEPTLYIHEPPDEGRQFLGVGDFGVGAAPGPAANPGPAAAVLPPPVYASLPEPMEVVKLLRIEIRDQDGLDLVTVVELLSPTNKYAGDDRDQYLAKRRELLRSGAHLVELDLLRGGPRMPLRGLPSCDYCAAVSRVEDRPRRVGVWPWRLRDPMPVVPIPLREGDRDATLDIKAVLDRAYDDAGYADYIYAHAPEPRLSAEDAAWAAQFVPPGPPSAG